MLGLVGPAAAREFVNLLVGEVPLLERVGLADPRVDLVRVARPVPHSDVHQPLRHHLGVRRDKRDDTSGVEVRLGRPRRLHHADLLPHVGPPIDSTTRSSSCGTPCGMLVDAQRLVDEPGHRRP